MKKLTLRTLCLVSMTAVFLSACGGNNAISDEEKEPYPVKNIIQTADPTKDDTLNILMIGNSFCYYFPDELYGLADAAGVKIRVCNVYYSGCTLEQHYTWWKDNSANYEFFTYDENGRNSITGVNLDYCLRQQNWDVISLQEASGRLRTTDDLSAPHTYRDELLSYLKEQFPQSELYWHQTWSYQVGYDRNGYAVTSAEEQEAVAAVLKTYALDTCEKFGIKRVNTGEAWQIARANPAVGDNLCARMAINNGEGDYYHDGDIGGGQYLNACVWFEVLTGQSCVGNTFRPTYFLSEDMVAALQQCAHEAVANLT